MLSRISAFLFVGLLFVFQSFAQTETEDSKTQASSSVSGRITLENKPTENISVLCLCQQKGFK